MAANDKDFAFPLTPGLIVRRLMRALERAPLRFRACPRRACRRHQRCDASDPVCLPLVLSPEQQAETLAQLMQAMERQGR